MSYRDQLADFLILFGVLLIACGMLLTLFFPPDKLGPNPAAIQIASCFAVGIASLAASMWLDPGDF